jgi:hypothetical protein
LITVVGLWLLRHPFLLLSSVAALAFLSRALLAHQSRRDAARLHMLERVTLDLTDRECDLAAKLLQTLHLSVAERQELPGATMRFSTLVSATRVELARAPYLPSSLSPDADFDGIVLEFRDDVYWIHERHEASLGKFGPTSSRRARDLRDAVRAYVNAFGGSSIDAVPIDHNA